MPSAPYRASITIGISTKVAAEIDRPAAASIASMNRRRSGSSCRMASRADVSMTIRRDVMVVVAEDDLGRTVVEVVSEPPADMRRTEALEAF